MQDCQLLMEMETSIVVAHLGLEFPCWKAVNEAFGVFVPTPWAKPSQRNTPWTRAALLGYQNQKATSARKDQSTKPTGLRNNLNVRSGCDIDAEFTLR